MLRSLFLALLTVLATNPSHAETPDMPLTALHRAITQQTQWLNTARALTPDDLKGRIILLDFWTYCCINCMHVIPDLHYLEKTFGDKLTVIGVHSAKFINERDSENIRNAMLRYDIQHPVVNDYNFAVWQSFGVNAWPTFVLINPSGTIEEVYSGEGNRAAVEADIRKLLTKFEGRINSAKLPIALEKTKMPPQLLDFPGKLAYVPSYKGAPALALTDSGHDCILLMDLNGTLLERFGSETQGFKDGDAKTAQFHSPQGILAGKQDGKDVLYVADTQNHALRRIWLDSGKVETLAGTGEQGSERRLSGVAARNVKLASPWALAFYPDDKHLVIAMAGTHQLWSYDLSKNTLSVLAGNGRESIDDGEYPYNSLSQPSGLATFGNKLYFVDSETSALRVLENGEITTLIGTGLFDFGYKEGVRGEALMQHPLGLYADASGVYIADSYNHSIRRYNPATGTLHDYAGHGVRGAADGTLQIASFNEPNDLVRVGDLFYITDTNNHRIRVIDINANTVRTLPVGAAAPAETGPEILPNLGLLPHIHVSMAASILNLKLAEGWKINAEAPSTLKVTRDGDSTAKPLHQFTLDQIKKLRMPLPTMDGDHTYHLSGTLYYCEEKEGSQCLVKSFDVKLIATPEGETEINLQVN